MVLQEEGFFDVYLNGRTFKIETTIEGKIKIQNQSYLPSMKKMRENLWLISVNDISFRIEFFEGRIYVNGNLVEFSFRASIPKLQKRNGRDRQSKITVQAFFPGFITDILVKSSDKVKSAQAILYLEAMKMRNEIQSPINGKVVSINVKKNQKVAKGDILFVIRPLIE